MPEEPLTFEALNEIYRREKGKQELQKLEPDFYERLAEYLQSAKKKEEESHKKHGPNSAGSLMMRDEYRKASQRADAIIETRMRKVMEMARLCVHGAEGDTKNMQKREAVLMNDLILIFSDWREGASTGRSQPFGKIMRMECGADAPGAESSALCQPVPSAASLASAVPAAPEAQQNQAAHARDTQGPPAPGAGKHQHRPEAACKEATVVVTVLADVPPFAGIDHTYTLKKGDVVSLPAPIAEVLCRSRKARRIL